jgi:hypothetical protein
MQDSTAADRGQPSALAAFAGCRINKDSACVSLLTVAPWERSVGRQAFAEALGGPQKQAEEATVEAAHRVGRRDAKFLRKKSTAQLLSKTRDQSDHIFFQYQCVTGARSC